MTAHSSNDGGFGPLTVEVARGIIKDVEKRLAEKGLYEIYINKRKERMAWEIMFRDDILEKYNKYGRKYVEDYFYNRMK